MSVLDGFGHLLTIVLRQEMLCYSKELSEARNRSAMAESTPSEAELPLWDLLYAARPRQICLIVSLGWELEQTDGYLRRLQER